MKIFFYCLVLITSVRVSAQVQLPPISAEWHYSKNANPFLDFFTWRVTQDTMIQGKTAKLLTKYNSNNNIVDTDILLLQNDSVLYWHNNQFHLMYDFASAVGDTVIFRFRSIALSSAPVFQDTILSVSAIIANKQEINVNGISLLSVETSLIPIEGLEDEYIWPSNFNYIQQIGHDYLEMGVIYSINLPSTGQGSRLRCYNNFQNLSYQTPYWMTQGEGQSCDFSSSISEINFDDNTQLYPNPSNGLLHIEVPNGVVIERIEWYDVLGKKVKTHNGNHTTLSIADIPEGTYLIKFHTNEGITTKRLIREKLYER